MTSKLSYEDVRRLARMWFAEAREKSNRDDADVENWKKEQRKWNSYGGGCSDLSGGDDGGGDCGGGD
jgi:hypothetical protein